MSAGEMAPSPSHTNRLINEKSPYLLQHAHNPVDWFPWGDEAFARAKQQDKPVFLSIGYATCHWCHVMAHESFEDEDVAALLNDAFVCVKVDREERPDIDGVYMTACQLTVGHGGWPLTVLLTPDKQPFFAGTFFPKATRPNLIGMLDLVPRLKAVWDTRRQEVTESVDQIAAALTKATLLSGSQSLDETVLDQAFNELRARFDPINGGFGTRPKFPTPHQLTFLLRYWKRTKNDKALEMVETTLTRMRQGGLWDHVGFGFHRYSTDAQWLLPHFEKMLYDQAMLAIAYTETYQATGKYIYRQTAEEIFAYVLGEMTSPEGGFYCAEDADSEGEEGKFYVWSESQLREVLSKNQAALTINVFCIEPEGNFFEEASGQKTGANILHLKQPLPEKAIELGLTNDDLTSQLDVIRQKLLKHRANRIRPLKDDKILADWNGLMIAALSKAARAFEQPRYAQAAKRAVEFVQQRMMDAGKLRHSVREGEVGPQCFLSDHAFFVWGLLELYETTFDLSLLNSALTLNERLIQEYWDDAGGAFYTTTHHAEMLPVRQKDFHDGATPSGNAVAMLNLLKLARFLGHHELEEMAHRLGTALSDHVRQSPAAFTQLLQAVDFALSPSREIVIASPSMPDASEMIHATRQGFWPNQIVVFISDSTRETITQLLPLLNEHKPLDQKPTAYVCQRFHCERPVTNAQALSKLLGDAGDHEKRPM